ncbi:hypothetical protein FVF58_09415 [Paraburkholderia panacisoli]|uniref:Uncharacterized protein n=1 Tax=Paraburkholderia panacisoli TaxID=2603818 RepID=A0A5B0HCH9_9BURK|nr:hypothetical protein [Paraburkholderia panacisoli]KAA1012999.1 hypothetical protein FVF58_09415 [Paraburkholderia panacisoli]
MEKKPKVWIEWTTTEIRILKEIWACNEPMKTKMHLLPRHSLRATLFKGQSLGLPARHNVKSEYSPAFAILKHALETSSDHAKSLAERTGVSYRRVGEFLKVMHDDNRIHITGWRKTELNGPPFPIYAWGEGDDVRKPQPAAMRNRLKHKSPAKCANNPFGQLVAYARETHREAA